MGRPKKVIEEIAEQPSAPIELTSAQIKESIQNLLNKSQLEIVCLELKINVIEQSEYIRRIGDLKDFIKEMKGLVEKL